MIDIAEFPPGALHYTMTLFVTGATRLSLLAVANVRDFCETELAGNYSLRLSISTGRPNAREARR